MKCELTKTISNNESNYILENAFFIIFVTKMKVSKFHSPYILCTKSVGSGESCH